MNVDLEKSHSPAAEEAPPAAPDLPETLIEARKGWNAIDLKELWRYRELLFFLVWRDVKVRYKQTALGAAWAVLHPLLLMLVFTIFFGTFAGFPSGQVPYPLFAYSGLVLWVFFASSLGASGASVVDSGPLISKIYFPRLLVPLASVGVHLVDFTIGFVILLGLMAVYGWSPGWGLLLVPFLVIVTALGAVGLGTLLAALNVVYRDIRYVIPLMVQLWMFSTPTIYTDPSEAAGRFSPAEGGSLVTQVVRFAARATLDFNPMAGLVSAFRAAALDQPIPWGQVAYAAAVMGVLFLAGCYYFRRTEDAFADII
jgi:lipopolysaccharide transport system permease protein